MQPCEAGGPRDSGSERSARRARVYSRAGCHLCDEAILLLKRQGYTVATVNIDDDADLRERFNDCVPVVEIGGKVRFRGKINSVLLRRLTDHIF